MTDSSAPSSSSRKRRTASIVQNINLDDVGPLTIQKRTSRSMAGAAQPKVAEPCAERGVQEVNRASVGRLPSLSTGALASSEPRRGRGSVLWVQGLFAVVILAAAGWVVLSPERHIESPSIAQPAAKR